MSTHLSDIQLSNWSKAGVQVGWRKNIGQRTFYFGEGFTPAEARKTAMRIMSVWTLQVESKGLTAWTPEALTEAKGVLTADQDRLLGVTSTLQFNAEASKATGATQKSSTSSKSSLTVLAAVEIYRSYLKAKVPHQIAKSNYDGQCRSLDRITDLANLLDEDHQALVQIASGPLSDVGFDQLHTLVSYFASRPVVRKTGEQMAVETAVNTVRHMAAFFDWLDASGKWDGPKRLNKVFRLKRTAMMTALERKTAHQIDVFTVDDLVKLYQSCVNDRQRCFLLLAMNIGATQQQLSSLLKLDIHLDAKVPFIELCRNKTAVYGKWFLWSETAKLLKKELAEDNAKGLALLTSNGCELVHYDGPNMRRCDVVLQMMSKLTTTAGVEGSFKMFRSSVADLVRKLSDLETSQTFLAHAAESVAEQHYVNRDWNKLAKVLERVHQTFVKAGMFEKVAPPKRKTWKWKKTLAKEAMELRKAA